MNRPLALIEGDLALPSARPLGVLPPPFGLVPPEPLDVPQREPQRRPTTAAQQAMQNAVQPHGSPRRRGPFPPNAKFLFFYRLPKRRDDSHKFEAQLAEARYYLDADKARPNSTRSDHLIGGAIFAACSIALAWLLATCTTHDAGKATSAATAAATSTAKSTAPSTATAVMPPAASTVSVQTRAHPQDWAEPLRPPGRIADATGTRVSSATTFARKTTDATRLSKAVQKTVHADAPKPQHVERLALHPGTRESTSQTPIASLSKPEIDSRVALSRAVQPAVRPSASKQPEWAARPTSANDAAERAALFDWAVQQRRASMTTRGTTSVPVDNDWNARMTQRRVLDNPDAFKTDSAGK